MTALQIYVSFPGTAREALGFYADVFGGELALFTYEEFNRTDGPPDAIAHGQLSGAVALAGSDAAPGEKSVRFEGLMLSLLGTAEPAVLHQWFDKLAVDGLLPLTQQCLQQLADVRRRLHPELCLVVIEPHLFPEIARDEAGQGVFV